MRLGSTGDPLRWYSSHPANSGPLTSHLSRLPSDVSMNAPLRVPTRTRTLLIDLLLQEMARCPRDRQKILSKSAMESTRACECERRETENICQRYTRT